MVKIKLKTLANKTFDMDLGADMTVADLKTQIHETFSLGEPDLLKLIYTGKVLKDDSTISQANIKENAFIVVMASKKKEQQQPPPTPAPVASPQPPAAVPSPASPAPVAASAAAAAPSPVEAPALSDTGLVRGPALEQAVESLMALGFERPQVLRALQASFNNPDRAAEYLFSGIPDRLVGSGGGDGSAAEASSEQAGMGHGGGAPVDLATFQQMFQDRPELIDALINQIGQNNPVLLQQLGSNRQGFAQLLQNPTAFANILQSAGIIPSAGGDNGSAPDISNNHSVIQVTQADRQAVERLESLGFSRDRALEAYIACDRNEEIAANYLFESGNEADNEE